MPRCRFTYKRLTSKEGARGKLRFIGKAIALIRVYLRVAIALFCVFLFQLFFKFMMRDLQQFFDDRLRLEPFH